LLSDNGSSYVSGDLAKKHCADLAATVGSQKLKSVYSSMARSWLTFAGQIERTIEAKQTANEKWPEKGRFGRRPRIAGAAAEIPVWIDEVVEASDHKHVRRNPSPRAAL
jgi:hypothetical protein